MLLTIFDKLWSWYLESSSLALCHHHTDTFNGPLTRYVKLRVAHAPGMPGTFSLPPWVSNPDMHHGTCVTHVPWCMSRSLTSGFLWIRWRGKRSRHSRRMRNLQFYISGKRPIVPLQPPPHKHPHPHHYTTMHPNPVTLWYEKSNASNNMIIKWKQIIKRNRIDATHFSNYC